MEQYFTKNPTTQKEIYKFDWNLGKDRFYFYTSNSVFSKNGVDFGSMLLVETVKKENANFKGNILDLGCGYGPIGVMLAKLIENANVTMSDVNERALELAKMNAEENKVKARVKTLSSSAFENINENFDMIVTNPPIRAGKDVVFSFYEGAYEHLNEGGHLYVVIQKKQGAPSTKEKLESLFGNCETAEKKSGYFIFRAVK
ncbi:Ribosomal RNA small subunit methyltransferase C [bioreactor metagenome]|jgi:16S rRNA (guanine1207-N2)-methyltransferase|uniref:Ribosomal RNA small subunit methyltransferase C n=1 Tax=bioreactor metagenome TaxID=1076179 RepID=A0A644YBU5_9ZZZZ|nr:class I SAM-dependent methyltransferase [Sedimentibacter saalensis]MEA5096358.1 class I SAM-dependent methyltransferase [Sedimentibacter saalensis]